MFRFTIRDVLWLMVVVGMGVMLWLQHLSSARQHARDIERIKERDGVIEVVENQLNSPNFDREQSRIFLQGLYFKAEPLE